MLLKKKAQESYQTNIQKEIWLCESWMSLEQNLFQSKCHQREAFPNPLHYPKLSTPWLGLPQ